MFVKFLGGIILGTRNSLIDFGVICILNIDIYYFSSPICTI